MSALGALTGIGLIGMLLYVVTGVVIGALLLSLAYRLVVGFRPDFLRAIAVVVVSYVAYGVVSWVLRLAAPAFLSGLVGLVACFLVGAAIINILLPGRAGQVGYGKACLVQLLYLVFEVVALILVGIVVAVMFGGMIAAMHH